MNKLDLNSFTKEQIEKAMKCETPEELIALAKAEGIEITKEQAEAYLDEMDNIELDAEALDQVAGGNYNPCFTKHSSCFACDSEVAVPGGIKLIKDLKVGDKVITLDASGKEIVGVVTEVMKPSEEEIVEVTFSDGTLWRTTESQTLYLAHKQNCMVKFAKGKEALLRNGGTVTVLDVKYTGKHETVYDVLVGDEGDENVLFVSGIATEGYFTKGELELLHKASECKTADDAVALAEAHGITLTKEEAEVYIA